MNQLRKGENNMNKDNKLQVILAEQGIAETDVAKLIEAFGGPFEEAGTVLSTYKDIVVTKEDDVAGMQKAREARLLLKKARTTVENSRKNLKADIVKQGRAIDSVARFVKEEIEPAENYLQLQEDFAKIAAEGRLLKLKNERIEKLMQYTNDISVYDLDHMSPEQFDAVLAGVKAQFEAEKQRKLDAAKAAEAAKKAEEKRVADQAKENERLKAEAEAANKKAAAEKAEREKLEQEKRDREAAELKAKQDAEAAKAAELAAPDKQKLVSFANGLNTVRTEKLPKVSSEKAQQIISHVDTELNKLLSYIYAQAEEL
jgi:hypothetical protein